MIFFLLLLPPLLAALLAFIVRPYRTWVGWVNACLSLLPLAAALIFASQAIAAGEAPAWGMTLGPLVLDEVLRVDSLAALIMVCVAAVATWRSSWGPAWAPVRIMTPASCAATRFL